MGLERTPPQKANQAGPSRTPRQSDQDAPAPGNVSNTTALASPTRAFMPRNPGVMRSPEAGEALIAPTSVGTSMAKNLPHGDGSADAMEIEDEQPIRPAEVPESSHTPTIIEEQAQTTADETARAITPEAAPSPAVPATSAVAPRTPAAAGPSQPFKTPEPQTRGPKTPRSTRKSAAEIASVLDRPPAPIPVTDLGETSVAEESYGRRWQATVTALEEASKAGAKRWQLKHLEQCFPTLAANEPEAMKQIYLSASTQFKENVWNSAYQLIDHYQVGPSLRRVDEMVEEGKAYAKAHPSGQSRPNAWRADLSPAALAAAAVLPVYDNKWRELRSEYTGLHEDCRSRYVSLLNKQAELKELEASVADGVVELEETLKLFDGFPSEDMTTWMEDLSTRLPGLRQA